LVLPEGITFPGELPIDVPFEASKLPLDVAVFNSARGASENALAPLVAKFLENVLLVGGGSLVPGLAHMLQQRCAFFVKPGSDASYHGTGFKSLRCHFTVLNWRGSLLYRRPKNLIPV
jgi:hypothetical protein